MLFPSNKGIRKPPFSKWKGAELVPTKVSGDEVQNHINEYTITVYEASITVSQNIILKK